MVNWNSPTELARENAVFTKIIFVCFGLYVWELFQTCGFEWSLITRKRKFTWPLWVPLFCLGGNNNQLMGTAAFFFLSRYCILFALIGLILSLSVTTPINCGALYTFNSWTGNMSILAASTSLMIRTIALWDRDLKIVIPLSIFCVGHWAILWRGMFIVHAQYSAQAESCIVVSTDHVFLNVGFFTTMAFDFTILCFTIAVLWGHKTKSDLWHLLFQDGLVYFFITFACNGIPAVLNVLNLNTLMNVIATIPAATASSIAACRLVIRLQDYSRGDAVYVHSAEQAMESNGRGQIRFTTGNRYKLSPEVRVTTDHFVMQDFSPASASRSPATEKDVKPFDLEASSGLDDVEELDRDSDISTKRDVQCSITAV